MLRSSPASLLDDRLDVSVERGVKHKWYMDLRGGDCIPRLNNAPITAMHDVVIPFVPV